METGSYDRLMDASRRIAPVIRAHREEAENNRRISRPALDAMIEAGLLRMLTPRSLGGLEVDSGTFARVVEEVSTYDSASGWTLGNPSAYAFACARMPDEGVSEIFSSGADPLIAGSGAPPMKATPVDSGYRVAGQVPFVSNCQDANWLGATAMVMEHGQPVNEANGDLRVVAVYLPMGECQIIDTWSVMGIRGTGSHDVVVEDVFVPSHRTYPYVPEFEPGSHFRGPLYRFPMVGIAAAAFPTVMLAVARNAMEEVSALAASKTPLGQTSTLREQGSVQAALARAEGAISSARALLYGTIGRVWELAVAGTPYCKTRPTCCWRRPTPGKARWRWWT